MKKHYIITIVIAIVVGLGGFYGGTLYQKSVKTTPTGAGAFRQAGINGQRGTGGFRGTMGQILSMDSKSITVSVPGGGSKIIFFSGSTSVSKTVSGAVSDLKVGDNIVATGTTNTDGSVSATDISLRPAGAPLGAPGANANRPAPTPAVGQ
jgi:hypothetical protein